MNKKNYGSKPSSGNSGKPSSSGSIVKDSIPTARRPAPPPPKPKA